MPRHVPSDDSLMIEALRLAARAYGDTSPNPMVGAVLVKGRTIIGRGWHRKAGMPHAEIEAIQSAARKGEDPRGATLFVTLEPCSTHGRTPPCTDAIIRAGIKRVVAAATDPNPSHAGRGFNILKRAGIEVTLGVHAAEANRLNEAFNHWIVHRSPFVTVKAAMSLDGKIATRTGASRWITGEDSRAYGMHLRRGSDAIMVGINTVLADNPALTVRPSAAVAERAEVRQPLRIVLDSVARTPMNAQLVSDGNAARTIVVVTAAAPRMRASRLRQLVTVWESPLRDGTIDIGWVLNELGKLNVTSLLVEGGGEANASFLLRGHGQRVAFFYAPKIIGGAAARKGVSGKGISDLAEAFSLQEVEWKRLGPDLLLRAKIAGHADR